MKQGCDNCEWMGSSSPCNRCTENQREMPIKNYWAPIGTKPPFELKPESTTPGERAGELMDEVG